MKGLILISTLFLLISCETKFHYIDTGICNGEHNMSMYEYFKTDSYNWDTTRLLIERAGLVDLFEGKVDTASKITFFGPTNHTIRNWMYDSAYVAVDSIPVEECRSLILKHVVKGVYTSENVPIGSVATATDPDRKGGIYLTSFGNGRLWFYTVREPYYGIEDAGPIILHLESVDLQAVVPLACPNIQTRTGVVHSLEYAYYFGDI